MSIHFVDQKTGVVHDSGLCMKELNLLAHAQMIELDIGSQCGGHGKCGRDLIQVRPQHVAQFSPLTDAERRLLTPEQIKNGFRLACQVFPERGAERSSEPTCSVVFTGKV